MKFSDRSVDNNICINMHGKGKKKCKSKKSCNCGCVASRTRSKTKAHKSDTIQKRPKPEKNGVKFLPTCASCKKY